MKLGVARENGVAAHLRTRYLRGFLGDVVAIRCAGAMRPGAEQRPARIVDLDEHVERRRGLALENRFLRPSPASFLVGQRHALDATEEVVERRVDQEILQRLTVRGGDELNSALGNRARRRRLELSADLVDDDDLGHVVLDRLDHHRVLQHRSLYLHATRPSDAGMRDVAVAADLV